MPRQRPHRREAKEVRDRELASEHLLDRAQHPYGEQRVAAEIEEAAIVIDAFDLERLAPEFGQATQIRPTSRPSGPPFKKGGV